MTKLKTILAGSLIAIMSSGIAMADTNKHHNGGKHMMGGSGLKDINLSDAQKAQLKAMRAENKQNRQNSMKRNFNGSKFFTQNGFDKRGFVEEMNIINAERTERMANKMEKIYAILTPEQRVKFIESMRQREENRLQRHKLVR